MSDVADRLEDLRKAGLYRRLRLIESPQGPRVTLDGAEVLLLCSNNYLGLADHPRVRQAAADAGERFGAGAGASRLVSGNMSLHGKLEERLAAFSGYEAALLFGSGYLANLGTIAVLAGRGQVVFSDELNHASIIDGCRISRAERFIYRHADIEHLSWGLRKEGRKGGLIVTDAVFSMDGDLAPLEAIAELAQRYGARVVVDEAHATGVVGARGHGLVAELGLEREIDVTIGTLGKALGSYGAFACCSAEMALFLVNRARTVIYSTALPPAALGAALAALDLLEDDAGLMNRLHDRARTLRVALADEGFAVEPAAMPIVPLLIGDPGDAMAVAESALDHGVFAQAIRPPTVPEGTSRLRLVATAAHEPEDLLEAARVLASATAGLIPAAAGR